ncbi:MAG: 6-bladed beta-propeller [Bacteroidales bacterium]|nr:6-bladed beta-propeller [Bacteroidales bacterium]
MRIKYAFIMPLLLCGCGSGSQTEGIPFINAGDDTAWVGSISQVELISLDETGGHMLGEVVDLQLLPDGYILTDRRNANIFNFADDGTFRNRIGTKGRGPGEYQVISNVQVRDRQVLVFSYPDKVLYYTPEGEFLKEMTDLPLGQQTFAVDRGFLTYYGYTGERPYRAALIGAGGAPVTYLDVENPLMPLSLDVNIFSEDASGDIFFTDSYNPVVHRHADGRFAPVWTFDFGQYSIGKEFFKFKDVFQGAEHLMSSNYALVQMFLAGDPLSLVEVFLKRASEQEGMVRYALLDNETGECRWFRIPGYDKNPIGPFHAFKGDVLYALISPERISDLSGDFISRISNPEVLSAAKAADSHVIARIRLGNQPS